MTEEKGWPRSQSERCRCLAPRTRPHPLAPLHLLISVNNLHGEGFVLFELVAFEETGRCDGEEFCPVLIFVRRRQAPPGGWMGALRPERISKKVATQEFHVVIYVCVLAARLSFSCRWHASRPT